MKYVEEKCGLHVVPSTYFSGDSETDMGEDMASMVVMSLSCRRFDRTTAILSLEIPPLFQFLYLSLFPYEAINHIKSTLRVGGRRCRN